MRFHSNNTCLRSVQMEGADSFIESRPQPHVLSIPQLLWLPPSLSCSRGRIWACGKPVNLVPAKPHRRNQMPNRTCCATCAGGLDTPLPPYGLCPERKRECRVDRVPTRLNFVKNIAQRLHWNLRYGRFEGRPPFDHDDRRGCRNVYPSSGA